MQTFNITSSAIAVTTSVFYILVHQPTTACIPNTGTRGKLVPLSSRTIPFRALSSISACTQGPDLHYCVH